MALTKDDLQAIGAMLDSKLEPFNVRLEAMQSDIETIKEDGVITREAVNTLLDWANIMDDATLKEVIKKRAIQQDI